MPVLNRAHATAIASWLSFAVAVAAVVAGAALGGRSYVIVSVIVVACAIVPFFVQFESRRPQAREIALIAVLCALAVASRAAFAWVPHFKPIAGIVMISGMALGPGPGFLVGSVSMLASNFLFGQGPWTPWQMLAFGSCGLVFGLLVKAGAFPNHDLSWPRRIALSVAGAAYVIFVEGPMLDTSSLFYMLSSITPEGALATYLAGFPVNCIQGAATFATLLLVANPLLSMIRRVRVKYGMFG